MKKRLIALLLLLTLLASCSVSLADYYRVNTSWLKAHDKPSYAATVVDSYRRDFACTVLKDYGNGWAKVQFWPAGHKAYVRIGYLRSSKEYTAYVKIDSTLLRPGPAKTFPATAVLNRGAKVTVLTHGTVFDYVSTSKGNGYIMNTLLTKNKPSGRTVFIVNPSGLTVNLRQGPGKQYKVIAEYRPGTKATLLKAGVDWCHVTVKGKTGYMMTKYLDLD